MKRVMKSELRAWVLRHDESRVFLTLYFGLAVVLSIAIGLFWLVAVVGVHFALETVRQYHARPSAAGAAAAAAWEINLDLALVLLALVLALYMDLVLGAAGLQAVGRLGSAASAGARGGARLAGWNRALRGILLSLDDAAQVGRVVSVRLKGGNGELVAVGEEAACETRRSWSRTDRIAVALGLGCALLLLFSPHLTDRSVQGVVGLLLAELHPFPG